MVNQEAKKLIQMMKEYKEESLKSTYEFTPEEFMTLFNELLIMKKHLEMLADYTTKNK